MRGTCIASFALSRMPTRPLLSLLNVAGCAILEFVDSGILGFWVSADVRYMYCVIPDESAAYSPDSQPSKGLGVCNSVILELCGFGNLIWRR